MTTPQYPLIARLGATLWRATTGTTYGEYFDCVKADSLERILSEAPVVYGQNPGYGYTISRCPSDTHSYLVVGADKIAKDSAESLLREFIEKYGELRVGYVDAFADWRDRAKRLLEGK